MLDLLKPAIVFSQDYWLLPILIFSVVFGLFLFFILKYWRPANRLNKDLQEMISSSKEAGKATNQIHALKSIFEKEPFLHAWSMYYRTLRHVHREVDGEQQVVGHKSTAPSGYFFDQTLLIDTPLKVEFFKHLPSLMTGIGIIGTFAGLLLGLLMFDPAGDPANVQNSLDDLLHGVSEAFVASGAAILFAMWTTYIEKSKLRAAYANLEELTACIDRIFEADDVGEEYLEKLVKSSAESVTQTKQLKDSLVDDLKTMMTNIISAQQQSQQELAQRLIEASAQNSRDMAAQIGQSITDSLQNPLEKIANSVQQVSGDQGAAVQDLLTDVLTAFMNRLESTFGSQMSGMSEMMGQSVSAMREMQAGFNQLIADMRQTNESSAQALEQQMMSMLTQIQQKQHDMGDTMNEMLQQVQKSVASIGDTGTHAAEQMNAQMTDMLSQMNQTIAAMMADIGQQRVAQDRLVMENQQALHQTTTGMMDELKAQITRLLEESQIAIQSHRQNIDKLSQVTVSSITGMNDGAEKMRLAADRFNSAGQSLNQVTEGSSQLLAQVNTIASGLSNTTSQLRTLVSDYQQSKNSVDQAIQTLEKLIATARQEAGMSSQMLKDMEQMTQALQTTRQDIQAYLGQVNDVLAKAFGNFGDSVESSLNKALGAFDNTLDQAVSRLSSGIESLSDVTEELAEMVQRNTRRI